MIKKILKWIGIVIAALIVIIIALSVVLMLVIDEKFVAAQMEKALNRHVTIEKLSVGVFSVASGIEVKNVRISNYKTPAALTALKDKPVPENDLFVGLKAFNFKVKIMQIFKGRFVLDELVLYQPSIQVIKNKKGVFNFADLMKPASKTPEKEEPEVKKVSKPLKADDIPVAVNIGKIGIQNGMIKYTDESLAQVFQIYNLTALVHSINIDPKDLQKKDSVSVNISTGIKTIGEVKTGSVKSFDIGLDIKGNVIPFDKKTRILNPEIALKAGLPYGSLTGLQIYDKMISIEKLAKYSGKFDFLKKDIKWKNAYVNIWYKDNLLKLKEGNISTDDYDLTYAGETNILSKAVNMKMDMLLADKHKDSIKSGITKNVSKEITGKLSKYVKPEMVTNAAMKAITNKDGKINLEYEVTGKTNDPDVKLLKPSLPSLKELVKNAAGDDAIKEEAKEKAKEAAEKGKDAAAKKAKKSLLKKLK